MKTLKDNSVNEIIIKNSKFINYLIKIDSPDIKKYLDDIKYLHPKATHHCYAFIYNDIKRFSDDKEPTGTAGSPMLNVLEKNSLNNTLSITVRYFGGIKLGAGGLIRAYTESITENLKNVELIELEKGYKVEIKFNYSDEKQINYMDQHPECGVLGTGFKIFGNKSDDEVKPGKFDINVLETY